MKEFLNKRNIINLLLLGIMVLAIPLTVRLARQQQILFSRAAAAKVEFLTKSEGGTDCVINRGGKEVAICNDIKVRFTAPTGDDIKFSRTSLLPHSLISTVYAGHLGYEANFCEGNSIVHEYADGTHEVQLTCGSDEVCKDLPNNDAGCEKKSSSRPTECTTACPAGYSGTCGGHDYGNGCVCETQNETCTANPPSGGGPSECTTVCPSGYSGTCGGHDYGNGCVCETQNDTCTLVRQDGGDTRPSCTDYKRVCDDGSQIQCHNGVAEGDTCKDGPDSSCDQTCPMGGTTACYVNGGNVDPASADQVCKDNHPGSPGKCDPNEAGPYGDGCVGPSGGQARCTITESCSGRTCSFRTTFIVNGQSQSSYRINISPDIRNPQVQSGVRNDDQTVTHTYDPGTYTAKLDAQSNDGGTQAACQTTPPFTVSDQVCTIAQSCAGTTCTFNHTYTVGGVLQQKPNYRVNLYPDKSKDNISTGLKNGAESLSHTYTPGIYTAKLFAQKNDGSGDFECETPQFTISGGPEKCFVCGNDGKYRYAGADGSLTNCPTATCNPANANTCRSTEDLRTKPCNTSAAPTIAQYRYAEERSNLATAQPHNFQGASIDISFKFANEKSEQKFLWVQFGDGAGNWTRAEKDEIFYAGPDPEITGSACDVNQNIKDGSLVFIVKGKNFGTKELDKSRLSADGVNLDINCQGCNWNNTSVTARMVNPPDTTKGKSYTVTLTRSDGVTDTASCSVATIQVSVGAKAFCRAPSNFDHPDVNLTVIENALGVGTSPPQASFKRGNTAKEVGTISKEGMLSLKTKLQEGREYIICLKACPTCLQICTDKFTAIEGTNKIPNFKGIPMCDVNEDGTINAVDTSQCKSQWGLGKSKTCDFNRDNVTNSFEWSCCIHPDSFNKSDQEVPK